MNTKTFPLIIIFIGLFLLGPMTVFAGRAAQTDKPAEPPPVKTETTSTQSGQKVTDQTAVVSEPVIPESPPLPERDQQGIEIRLQQAVFDPLTAPPALPPQLTASVRAAGSYEYYLVQFVGPIQTAWREEIEAAGATVMDYVPDFAYIVRMNATTTARVTELAEVRWVGLYQPAFRLSNPLAYSLADAKPDVTTELIVRSFTGEPAAAVSRQLTALGAVIEEQGIDNGGGTTFKLTVPETAVTDIAHITAVAWVESYNQPRLVNAVARSSVAMNKDAVETVLGLYGQNQIVVVGDTGVSTGNAATVHLDFQGHVFGGTTGVGSTCGGWQDSHSHGTHVAGSVLGSGVRSGSNPASHNYAGSNAGIAPEALLYAWGFCNDFSGLPDTDPYNDYFTPMYTVDSRARVNTNSWGYALPAGTYNTFSRETDRFIWNHPDMVVTFAAGNDGADANSNGVVDLDSMGVPAGSKNVITVGASENVRATGGYNPGGACSTWGGCWPADYPANPINSDRLSNNANGMAAFSSRGPVDDGRLKPDIVAPGSNIVSTRYEGSGTGWGVYDAYYLYMGGTSMATPLVAGASAIVREFYADTYSLNPSAALVKATLINGAADMTPGQYGAGATQDVTRRPDNNQGWGRVDLANSLIYSGDDTLWFHEDAGLSTNGRYQIYFDVTNTAIPLRATLAWVDQPGLEATHGALINDLDLEIIAPNGTHYYGNDILDGTLDGDVDRINNVEGVDLTPLSGMYTVIVQGYNVPSGPQPFALVVTGDVTPVSVGYLSGVVDNGATPLVGATVSAAGPVNNAATTNGSGVYTIALPAGSYDVTASAYAYNPATVTGITVAVGVTTTQNFSLTAAPSYTVSGVVTDAATGWPLYASIAIPGYPASPIWTNPETGQYSVTLPGGATYDFTVSAWVNGYTNATRTISPLSANTTENFALNANLIACNAPGYAATAVNIFTESFDTILSFPNGGWNQLDTAGTAGNWATNTATVHPAGQPPHSGARLAYFNSWTAAASNITRLFRTVDLNLSGATAPVLSFWMYHDTGFATSNDRIQVQISTNGGGIWTDVGTAVSRYNGTIGWQQHTIPLSAYAGVSTVRLGFNAISAYGNDIHIDDVVVANQTCTAPAGGLVIGNVYDGNTTTGLNGATVLNADGYSTTSVATPLDPGVADGFYTLYSPAGVKQFTASYPGYLNDTASPTVIANSTIRQDFNLFTNPNVTTVCSTPNLAIPDGNVAGVNNTLTIPQTGTIADVNLYLRGTHAYVGDLVFRLTHPNGTTAVTAVDRPGYTGTGFGCGSANFNLWLDDAGTNGPVESQCSATPPALFGRATPNNLLSAFNGLAANGVWTINASDRATPDAGILQEWCLDVTTAGGVWRGTQNSNWNNPQNWDSGAVPLAAANVTLSPNYLNGANAWPVLEVNPTVANLTLQAGAELTIPAGRSLTVNGTLTNNGLLRQTINNVSGPTTFLGMGGYGGVEINPAANMGNTTVVIRGNQACTNNPTSQHVQRCFDIAPTTAQTAVIRFYYLAGEANSNPENGVSVYHWNGGSWDMQTGTTTRSSGSAPRWVQVTGVSSYSPFVLDNNTPTAVSLSQFTAGGSATGTAVLLIIGLVTFMLLSLMILTRRKR